MVGRGGDLPNPIYFPISDKLFTIYTKTFNEKEKANRKLDQYVFDINKNLANPLSLIQAIRFFNNRNVKT